MLTRIRIESGKVHVFSIEKKRECWPRSQRGRIIRNEHTALPFGVRKSSAFPLVQPFFLRLGRRRCGGAALYLFGPVGKAELFRKPTGTARRSGARLSTQGCLGNL